MLIDFDSLSPGTKVFDQLPGLRFSTTPRIVTTTAGEHTLSNTFSGEEFNQQSIRIDFTELQSQVSMKAGLSIPSSAPIETILRAFDQSGIQIAQDGPKQVGPGPLEHEILFSIDVSLPGIRWVQLEYSGAFAELIDDCNTSYPPRHFVVVSKLQPGGLYAQRNQ